MSEAKKGPKPYVGRLGDRDDMIATAYAAHGRVETAINAFNAAVTVEYQKLAEALDSYNEDVREINAFRSDVSTECQDLYDERSETWQEGPKGELLQALIESWAEEFETLDDPSFDEFEVPGNMGDALSDLPERPDE